MQVDKGYIGYLSNWVPYIYLQSKDVNVFCTESAFKQILSWPKHARNLTSSRNHNFEISQNDNT